MINIYDSRTVRSGSTAQEALNDLARHWDGWHHIVDNQDQVIDVSDLDDATVVKEIWVSENIYIGLTSTNLTVAHISGATKSTSDSTLYSKFLIVTTDSCVLLRREPTNATTQNARAYIAVGKTVDPSGVESNGVIFKNSTTGTTIYMFTDHMSAAAADPVSMDNLGASNYNTVLTPMYALAGDEHFTDLMYVLASKPTDEEKILLNDQKYYLYNAVALPYT